MSVFRRLAAGGILALVAGAGPCFAADSPAEGTAALIERLDEFLAGPRAKLLILGTFHFDDAGLDDYKPKHAMDVLSPKRQAEIEEVVERLTAFEPTRVAVEWPKTSQEKADGWYAQYRRGELKPQRNEVIQLGFRLADRLDHPRVWLVDVQGRRYEPPIDRGAIAKQWRRKDAMDSRWWDRYERLSAWSDELKMKIPLRDYLLLVNSEPALRANHGQYFIGGFNLIRDEEYPGPDHLASWWYDRNLRIFANVQALAESPDDRIVLIIGYGHVPILRHAAQASPDVELVDVADVLGDR